MSYFVYILECSDGTFYTGYTTDLKRRLGEHNSSDLGAKYTRGRRPVILKYSKDFETLSETLKYENYLKTLSREEKKTLVYKS
ncbi:endonuclease [candidate division WWE3 bacterium CG_4_9_14_0_2_um_filter_35_11]|uniref:Endonuclease n=1 Tax=candidate division WWE3 bacterium CG_4_9_14_0_2_um_filter_35_11 TaxID=1975077 RepID=A0A2M8EMJ2_UNCKA|nr:MAG: endonuclease [candidate division WWE3 bacterium CG10_big_fil_rev_8_21_14_0_10_35_32]PJC23962.1 MAG: endonuclease [candidate division WWE3 bacterium CG_4_9_14_0_2_um_filter_35_11]